MSTSTSTTTQPPPRLHPTTTYHSLPIEIWLQITSHLTPSETSQLVLHSNISHSTLSFHTFDLLDLYTLPSAYHNDYDPYDELKGLLGEWRERRERDGFPGRWVWCSYGGFGASERIAWDLQTEFKEDEKRGYFGIWECEFEDEREWDRRGRKMECAMLHVPRKLC